MAEEKKDLDKNAKRLKFDKRLEEWNLRNGVLDQKELEIYLKELPDLTHNTQAMDFEEKNRNH